MPKNSWEMWAEGNPAEYELWKTLNDQARSDIIRYKQQQWQVAYYGTALYGGLIGLSSLFSSLAWMLALVSLAIGVAGCAVEWDLHLAIERSREKGKAAVRRFSPDVRALEDVLRENKRERPNDLVSSLLAVELAVGAFVTATLLSWTSAVWWLSSFALTLACVFWWACSLAWKLA